MKRGTTFAKKGSKEWMASHDRILHRIQNEFRKHTPTHRPLPMVTEVRDATEPIRIKVEQGDIILSLQENPAHCAMANACMRGGFDAALIRKATAVLIKGTTAYRYGVPASVSREIVCFDRHKDFRPGEYHLSAMSKNNMLGRMHNYLGGSLGQNKRMKPFVIAGFRHKTEGVR